MKARRGKSLRKSHFILVYLFWASGLTCLRNVVSEHFCSVHVLQLCFQMKMRTNRFVKNISPLFLIFLLHGNCLAHMTSPLHKKQNKTKKNSKIASASSADAGGRSLPVAIAGLHDVKVFPLPADTLCCEKGGGGRRLIKIYEKYEKDSLESCRWSWHK